METKIVGVLVVCLLFVADTGMSVKYIMPDTSAHNDWLSSGIGVVHVQPDWLAPDPGYYGIPHGMFYDDRMWWDYWYGTVARPFAGLDQSSWPWYQSGHAQLVYCYKNVPWQQNVAKPVPDQKIPSRLLSSVTYYNGIAFIGNYPITATTYFPLGTGPGIGMR